MAKPSSNNSTSVVTVISKEDWEATVPEVFSGDVSVDSGSVPLYNKVTRGVKLQSLLNARLEYKGQTSGKLYTWNSAGSIVEVNAEDSAILLAKRIGGQMCCGNSKDTNKLFQLVAD